MFPLAGPSLSSWFLPWTPVATLSVEDTCVLMHVFFFLSLWLFVLRCGGAGTWLHARGTHVSCRRKQCPHGKTVRGEGAGQGAPSLLSEFTLLLTSIADLSLAAAISSSVKFGKHHVPE